MRRCVLVAGAAAVCLTAGIYAPPAGARGVVVEARLSGVVSVVWQGSPERGCAAGGFGELPTSTVRVRQEMPSGPPATCVDALPEGFRRTGVELGPFIDFVPRP